MYKKTVDFSLLKNQVQNCTCDYNYTWLIRKYKDVLKYTVINYDKLRKLGKNTKLLEINASKNKISSPFSKYFRA